MIIIAKELSDEQVDLGMLWITILKGDSTKKEKGDSIRRQ